MPGKRLHETIAFTKLIPDSCSPYIVLPQATAAGSRFATPFPSRDMWNYAKLRLEICAPIAEHIISIVYEANKTLLGSWKPGGERQAKVNS